MRRTNLTQLLLAAAVGTGAGLGAALPHQTQAAMRAERGHPVAPMRVLATVVASAPSLAAAPEADAGTAEETGEVAVALKALASNVRKQSHPNALRYAFQAYFNYKSAHPEKVRKPYLYFVDYGLDNRTPRGYVFDMEALKVVDGPFTVAHGRGSGTDGVPTRFSNNNGSATSSLGLFLAQETYAFSGHANGHLYRSIGLRLNGLSAAFNSAARSRGVVAHGAPYVTPGRAGRSEGCPALEQARAQKLLPRLSNGGMVFLFSPNDKQWLKKDPWINES